MYVSGDRMVVGISIKDMYSIALRMPLICEECIEIL